MVMGLPVTNSNPNMLNEIMEFWSSFAQEFPGIKFPLQNFSGYSDSLAAACITLCDTYAADLV